MRHALAGENCSEVLPVTILIFDTAREAFFDNLTKDCVSPSLGCNSYTLCE